jgi:hypothetical protein
MSSFSAFELIGLGMMQSILWLSIAAGGFAEDAGMAGLLS